MDTIISEAEELKTASFGRRLLKTVGFIYENKAAMYLSEQSGEYQMFSGAHWAESG